jgi:ferrous iron transport protein A
MQACFARLGARKTGHDAEEAGLYPSLLIIARIMSLPLARAARNVPATVASVDWNALDPSEARRLREFGLDEGVEVELVKSIGLLGGPAAVRIGRMTVALRRHVAEAIQVAVAAE